MKSLFRILTVLCLLCTASCAQSSPSSAGSQSTLSSEGAEQTDDIYVFYTSDVHCGVDENLGYAKLKALVNDTKAEHEYVTLVDLGDALQGGTLGSISTGSIITDLMNAMEYDVVTYGNHEFDYGMYRLSELMERASFEYTVCNAFYSGSGTSVFEDVPAYIMKDYGGTKIAFIGVLAPETLTSSTPVYFMEDGEFVYDFCDSTDGRKLADQVQKTVDSARNEGADYVICLCHLGSTENTSPNDSISLIHNTTGIDAVLDGHSHSVIIGDRYPNADGDDVILSSVGTKMQNAGELIISPDGSMDTVLISEYDHEDETMRAAIDEANTELEELLSEKVAEIDFDLTITDENGIRIVRSRETNAADFVADAIRYSMGTDAALINGGGVRSTIEAGDITYGDLINVMPFGNTVGSCACTGQQILDALEYGARMTEGIASFDGNAVGEYGGFLQVSGLKYTIDTSVESGAVLDDNSMLAGFEGERRVKDVYILQDGEYVPLDPEAEYTVSSTDYILFECGDGNTAFQDCEVLVKDGPADVNMLIEYCRSFDTIPDSYRNTDGRITVQ